MLLSALGVESVAVTLPARFTVSFLQEVLLLTSQRVSQGCISGARNDFARLYEMFLTLDFGSINWFY